MPITLNTIFGAASGGGAAYGGGATTVATAAATVASGANRYVLGASFARDFGAPAAPTAIGLGSPSEALAQIGSTQGWCDLGGGFVANLSLWGLAVPSTGSGRVMTATFAASVLASGVAGVCYDNVDSVGDSDSDEGDGSGTSVTPSITVSTPGSVGKVVMVVAIRVDSAPAVTVSGETAVVSNPSDARTIHLIVVEKDATGATTAIAPTLSWTGSSSFQWGAFAVVLNEASGEITAEAADTVTFSDAAEAVVALPAVATDSVSFSDSSEASLGAPAEAEDTIEFTDSAVCVVGLQVVVEAEDAVTFTDSAAAEIGPPVPPAPPSSLPLPAKLLGRAPKKKRERPNVTFKPAEEALEAPEAPPAPEREPEIAPAPPPREDPVAPAQIEEPPTLLMPDVDMALVRDAALALVKPIEPIRVSTDTAEPAAPAPDVEPEPVVDKPLDPVARALLAVAGPLAEERAARRKLEAQVQALQLAVKALAANLKRMRQAQAERDARDAEEAENERRRALAKGIADALDE